MKVLVCFAITSRGNGLDDIAEMKAVIVDKKFLVRF